ncbi:putative receptor-like protein kinase [Camellia lanceoleosa]|uniref:Receptor-like protein kinase n=1 Tax=Camellia lanceoleosa TaxID=1840588 RepID=A0ACC0H0Y3_9ERIC|nr:putative receptor-like protein kinase [Camellia lanceoleosa]
MGDEDDGSSGSSGRRGSLKVESMIKINIWGGFSTTLCCRNSLSVLSQSLAFHATSASSTANGSLFLPQNQWINCTSSSSSPPNCVGDTNINSLFYGTTGCSRISLSSIRQEKPYWNALNKCDRFNSSPDDDDDDACWNCIYAILDLRDFLFDNYLYEAGMRNDTQRSICVAAAVISVAAGKLDDPSSFHHLFRCLALNAWASGTKKLLAAYLLTIIGLMVFIILIKFATKNNNRQHGINPKPVLIEHSTMTSRGLYRFSRAEIENAIVSGNGRTCLGGRGRGSVSVSQVLKGVLQSGQVVTIKQIDRNESNTSISNSESLTERVVEVLSMVRHPNLVCLVGFCMEHHGHHYLVYEYCSAGNLAQYLQRKDTVLTWERRVKILRDCALALNYLHHYMDGCLVHRHIKLSNILLSENMEAKLSDFVLEMMLRMEMLEKKSVIECAQVWEDIDLGYMDPEYMVNARLTCASDIYSFGIVILQLLSGLYVFDDLDLHARDTLRRKANDVCMGKCLISDFEDPRLNGNVNRVDFESILQIGVLCVAKSSKGRPSIKEVLDELDEACQSSCSSHPTRREMSSSATPISQRLHISLPA